MQTTPSGMEPWNLESLQLWGCKAGSMIFFSHKHYYWRNPRPVDEEPGQLAELYFMIVWIPMLCRFTAPHMRHMCFAVWRGKWFVAAHHKLCPKPYENTNSGQKSGYLWGIWGMWVALLLSDLVARVCPESFGTPWIWQVGDEALTPSIDLSKLSRSHKGHTFKSGNRDHPGFK